MRQHPRRLLVAAVAGAAAPAAVLAHRRWSASRRLDAGQSRSARAAVPPTAKRDVLWRIVLADACAGACAEVACIAALYPFDTMKVSHAPGGRPPEASYLMFFIGSLHYV